jgi:hypothetical protein
MRLFFLFLKICSHFQRKLLYGLDDTVFFRPLTYAQASSMIQLHLGLTTENFKKRCYNYFNK